MALLDDAIEASGGLARWNKLQRFTLHLSIKGTLFSRIGRARQFKDLIAEGSTQAQSVRFTGLTRGEKSGTYQPEFGDDRKSGWPGSANMAEPKPRIPGSYRRSARRRSASGVLLRLLDLELFDNALSSRPPGRDSGRTVSLDGERPDVATPARVFSLRISSLHLRNRSFISTRTACRGGLTTISSAHVSHTTPGRIRRSATSLFQRSAVRSRCGPTEPRLPNRCCSTSKCSTPRSNSDALPSPHMILSSTCNA